METSDYDISDLITLDVSDIDLDNITITSNSAYPSNITVDTLSTYSDTYIHSNEVCVIDEDGKETKILDELYRVSTELAVMRELMSTLLEKVKLDPTVELDFDKRVEHHRMLNKLAGE